MVALYIIYIHVHASYKEINQLQVNNKINILQKEQKLEKFQIKI